MNPSVISRFFDVTRDVLQLFRRQGESVRSLNQNSPTVSFHSPHHPAQGEELSDNILLLNGSGEPIPAFPDVDFPGIACIGLVQEESVSSLRAKASNLERTVPLSHKRWAHVSKLHFVFPDLSGGQGLVVAHAEGCHYQATYAQFKEAVSSFQGKIAVHIYLPGDCISNNFCKVDNDCRLARSIPWQELVALSLKESSNDSGLHQQFVSIDKGFTSSVSTSRRNSHDGIAEPHFKEGSNHPAIVKTSKILSDYVKQCGVLPWLPPTAKPFNYDKPDDPMQQYAQRIGDGVIFTGFHFGMTTSEKLLGCHTDKEQPSFDKMPHHALLASLSIGAMMG